MNVVKGTASSSAGASDTRAMNHVWSMNSRQANRVVKAVTKVSSVIAKKPPTPRTGVATAPRTPLEALPSAINAYLPRAA